MRTRRSICWPLVILGLLSFTAFGAEPPLPAASIPQFVDPLPPLEVVSASDHLELRMTVGGLEGHGRRLSGTFDAVGEHGYVWHCHILDHEDNEMMRPTQVVPNPVRRVFVEGVDY